MQTMFIAGRAALDDAAKLIESFGDLASAEAAARAESSRDAGNVVRFCHWRHIARVIVVLGCDEVYDTVH